MTLGLGLGLGFAQSGSNSTNAGATQYIVGVDNDRYNSVYHGSTLDGVTRPVCLCLQRWNTSPGTKTITRMKSREAFLVTAEVTTRELVVYTRVGTQYTLRGSYDLGVPGNNSTTNYDVTLSEPMVVTIPEGVDEVFYGARWTRPATSASSRPGYRGVVDSFLTSGSLVKIGFSSSFSGDYDDFSSAVAAVTTSSSSNAPLLLKLYYTNNNEFFETEIATPHSGTGTSVHMIPTAVSEQTSIFLKNVTATDTNTLTFALGNPDTATTAFVATQTVIHDMGATTPGTNVVTASGNNVTLVDYNDGTNIVSQDGNDFNYLIQSRPGGTGDVFWQNMTTGMGPVQNTSNARRDVATMSHAVKNSGVRGTEYTFASGIFIQFTGVGTVDTLQLAQRPVIIMGDSQSGRKNSDTANNDFNRLSQAWRDNLQYKYMIWLNTQSGTRIAGASASGSEAGQRYKSTTPGIGDICEITDMKFVLSGMGINDLVAMVSSEATAASAPPTLAASADVILADVVANGSQAVVMGLPPYSAEDAPTQDEWESLSVINFNTELRALGYPFHNPFSSMWAGTFNASNMYVFNPAYTDGDNLHYSIAGAQGFILI